MLETGGKNKKILLAIIVLSVLVSSIYYFYIQGKEIQLKVTKLTPVHLEKDYLTLEYAITDLDPSFFAYDPVYNGNECFVPLVKKGKYWQVKPGIVKDADRIEPGIIYIKGMVSRGGFEAGQNITLSDRGTDRVLHVVYGIEELDLPKKIDESLDYDEKDITAVVKIKKNRQLKLSKLLLDGKDWLK